MTESAPASKRVGCSMVEVIVLPDFASRAEGERKTSVNLDLEKLLSRSEAPG